MMFSPSKPLPASPQPPRRGSYTKDPVGLWADVPAFTAFAQEVHEAMEGTELRYSKRQYLLKRADHYGIKRFDANLVIAMVQHRLGGLEQSPPETTRRSPVLIAAVFLAVQSIIVIAGWWLIAP
jgi:hypothetical protein